MSASLHWRSLISLRGSKCTESTRILVSISVHREKGMIQEGIYHPIHSKKICLIRLYLFYLHSAQQQAQIYLQQYV